jgi:hypothetical protein
MMPSKQLGTHKSVTGWQSFPAQSASTKQAKLGQHFVGQAAPQSAEGSLPFLTPSLQLGALHIPPWHTALAQSAG